MKKNPAERLSSEELFRLLKPSLKLDHGFSDDEEIQEEEKVLSP